MEKTCKKCRQTKDIQDFYAHKATTDGRINFCKECVKERVRKHNSLPETKRKNNEWFKTEKGKNKLSRHANKYRAANKEKTYARNKLAYEIKLGKIEKQPCQVCGNEKVEAHHTDYSEPLKVMWLCFKHHMAEHNKITELQAR
jgi:hypothetical protein